MAPTSRVGGESTGCQRLHGALCDCYKRFGPGPTKEVACRHLNRALAECLISELCPEESEAVRALCSSGGTRLKRSQCEQAQLSLSVCISVHQQQQQD